MPLLPYPLARPFLFGLDPEHAHDLTLGAMAAIQRTPLVRAVAAASRRRSGDAGRTAFPNRIGLAAGLDKNGRCIDAFGALGFGFVEVGTVTPKAQPGNPKPRLFRLPPARALINRLGFNNEGLAAFIANVRRRALSRQRRHPRPEHRQERGDADRARGRRLPARPGRACIRTPTT